MNLKMDAINTPRIKITFLVPSNIKHSIKAEFRVRLNQPIVIKFCLKFLGGSYASWMGI